MIEAILNRLRGTGTLYHLGSFKFNNKLVNVTFNGNHLYGIWLALVSSYFYIPVVMFNHEVHTGIVFSLVLIAYLVGESKGWGEWVGALTSLEDKDEEWLIAQYNDKEGKGFPFIHIIANSINKEQIEGTLEDRLRQYNKYAITAIIIRGMFWWGLVYFTLAMFSIISYLSASIATVVLGIGFYLACEIGKRWNYNRKFGILSFSRGWENQEVIYGLMQGLTFWIMIFIEVL